jgi:TonB family protein
MRKIIICLGVGLCMVAALTCAASIHSVKTEMGNDPSASGAPILLNSLTPYYPPEAMAQGITGTVWIKIFVDTLGNVSNPMVLRDRGNNIDIFEKSAIDAALKTMWKPAQSKGQPIAVWITYKVDFSLK